MRIIPACLHSLVAQLRENDTMRKALRWLARKLGIVVQTLMAYVCSVYIEYIKRSFGLSSNI